MTETKRGAHKHLKVSLPVVQISMRTNEEVARFDSVYEASKITGINNINHCCKGRVKSAGNFKWMYASEYDELYKNNN